MEWMDVSITPPPEDGTPISVCGGDWNQPWKLHLAPMTVRFGSYHPNAKGKECFRTTAGVKTFFTHWMHLPSPPKS